MIPTTDVTVRDVSMPFTTACIDGPAVSKPGRSIQAATRISPFTVKA
ncbi:MAG TPA: hypothetical protein ACFYD4_16300 [Candidatus Wunengus sp. YC61]